MKQTAVEFLEKSLKNFPHIKHSISFKELINQAKEMEKEQIKDAFGVGCQHESKRLVGYQDVAEQYYNETFKSE